MARCRARTSARRAVRRGSADRAEILQTNLRDIGLALRPLYDPNRPDADKAPGKRPIVHPLHKTFGRMQHTKHYLQMQVIACRSVPAWTRLKENNPGRSYMAVAPHPESQCHPERFRIAATRRENRRHRARARDRVRKSAAGFRRARRHDARAELFRVMQPQPLRRLRIRL